MKLVYESDEYKLLYLDEKELTPPSYFLRYGNLPCKYCHYYMLMNSNQCPLFTKVNTCNFSVSIVFSRMNNYSTRGGISKLCLFFKQRDSI